MHTMTMLSQLKYGRCRIVAILVSFKFRNMKMKMNMIGKRTGVS